MQKQSTNLAHIARMIDISAVRANVTVAEVERLARLAKHYRFICAYAMPCFTDILIDRIADAPDIGVGGVVGFPSGADTTQIKVFCAKSLVKTGCTELDMVMNIGALKSGLYAFVRDDIRGVADVLEGRTLKVILEIAHLERDEIARACELAVEAGADFVKTGTGWTGTAATVEDIKLMKETVGNRAGVKAAGNIRTLDAILEMIKAGCTRFGIGYAPALDIMQEVDDRLGREPYTPE